MCKTIYVKNNLESTNIWKRGLQQFSKSPLSKINEYYQIKYTKYNVFQASKSGGLCKPCTLLGMQMIRPNFPALVSVCNKHGHIVSQGFLGRGVFFSDTLWKHAYSNI